MKRKPKLLDLFCGAGGCAAGYALAGFDVVGVDHRPQPRYPFRFLQADAMIIELDGYDVVHASPPCQAYSRTKSVHKKKHPELVPAIRQRLQENGALWVIENVPGAPLLSPAIVCGLALGCRVKRHRLFESSDLLFGTVCPKGHKGPSVDVTGHSFHWNGGWKGWVTVYGGGAPRYQDNRRRATVEQAALAMGIDWMTRDELSQAIPPAYTEFIGKQLIDILSRKPISVAT